MSRPEPSSASLRDDKHLVDVDTKDVADLDSRSDSGESETEGEVEDPTVNPFVDLEVTARWKKIYEEAQYECRHVFDPTLIWTEEEEKQVVRKLDWRICTWAVCSLSASPSNGP